LGIFDNVKVSNNGVMPLIPKTGSNGDGQNKKNDNRNIFEDLLRQVPQDTFEKSSRRLNDLDSSLLNENFVNFLPNDPLRLELQIGSAENRLFDTKNEINAVKLLDLDKDGDKLAKLEEKKNQLNQEIYAYKIEYRALGFIYKITDTVSSGYNKVIDKMNSAKTSLTSKSKVIKVKSIITGFENPAETKDVIDKYNALQTNVDKINSIKTNPFGEADNYFKDFTEVMDKLNKLDSRANKILTPEKPREWVFVSFGKKLYSKFIDYLRVQEEKTNS
jgi:hypothetical protein